MIKVYQTKFGPTDGNCFAACIASILELPIEQIELKGFGEDWLKATNEFLEPLGYKWLEVNLAYAEKYPIYDLQGQVCVFTVKSPRFSCNHCVVGKVYEKDAEVWYEVLHDPMPDSAFSLNERPIMLGFFIPIDPAKMKVKN